MTKYSLVLAGEYPRILPNFKKRTRCKRDLKDDKYCLDICHWTLSVPQSLQFSSSYALGTLFVSQNRYIMSADKYSRIFLHQMEAIFYLSIV